MSSQQFRCDLCDVAFNSVQALTCHKNRSSAHKPLSNNLCNFCNKRLSCAKSLKRHLATCKEKIAFEEAEREEEERKQRIEEYERKLESESRIAEITKRESEFVKKEYEYIKSKLDEEKIDKKELAEISFKTIQTVASNSKSITKNITKNITNNINVYNYIQPITQECLLEILKYRQKEMITSNNELVDLFADKLKDKAFQTDRARNVIMYKDGEEMKRDPNAKELSKQIFLVSAPELQPYRPLIEDTLRIGQKNNNLSIDRVTEECQKLCFLNSLSNPQDNSLLNEFGKNLAQKLPTREQFFRNQTNYTFFNLKILLEKTMFSETNTPYDMCQYFLCGIFSLGFNISRLLQNEGFIKVNYDNTEFIFLKQDEGEFHKDKEGKILTEIVVEIISENSSKILKLLSKESMRQSVNMLPGFEILSSYSQLMEFKDGEHLQSFHDGLIHN